jgi:hypothetical protein
MLNLDLIKRNQKEQNLKKVNQETKVYIHTLQN